MIFQARYQEEYSAVPLDWRELHVPHGTATVGNAAHFVPTGITDAAYAEGKFGAVILRQ